MIVFFAQFGGGLVGLGLIGWSFYKDQLTQTNQIIHGIFAVVFLWGHGLAKLLGADCQREHSGNSGQEFHDDSHGGFLPAMRRAPWPRVRRRTAADRAEILHELGGAAIRQGLKLRSPVVAV